MCGGGGGKKGGGGGGGMGRDKDRGRETGVMTGTDVTSAQEWSI